MTKRKKGLPVRKPRDRSRDDDSLLLRSAESLGRVIGALQRQLDGATKRLSDTTGDALDQLPSIREIADTVTPSFTAPKKTSRKQAPSRKRAATKKTAATKTKKASNRRAPSKKR